MDKTATARLLTEESGGTLIVEIVSGGDVVWSHAYMVDGATDEEYRRVINVTIPEDMVSCANWLDYDGCDVDDDGTPIIYGDYWTDVSVIAEYRAIDGEWTLHDGETYGAVGDDARAAIVAWMAK